VVKGGDGVTIGAARSVSIRGRLVRLVLVLFVPALLLTAGLIWSLERQASRTQERQLAATARTLALVVDSRIGEQVATLNALSVSRPLAQGDFAAFAEQARSALQSTEGWVERSAKFLVPEGAKTLDFMPALFQVETGTFDLDDMANQYLSWCMPVLLVGSIPQATSAGRHTALLM